MTNSYITKRGESIPVKALPQMLAPKVQVSAEKKAKELFPATLPTYEVPLMGGGTQTFAHDEKSLETDADRAVWRAYQDATAAQTAHVNNAMMRFYILEGTDVQLPAVAAWQARQEFYGVEIPDNEIEKLYHYITTHLLSAPEEIFDLVAKIMEASGIAQETLDAARVSFRGVVGQEPDTPERTDGAVSGAGPEGALVDLGQVSTNGLHGEMAAYAEPVGLSGWG